MRLPQRIVLVGLPGSGKSTAGRLVAKALGWRFIDLDEEIETSVGRSVRDIFASEGEAGFRVLERIATEAIAGATQVVIAPGGGWVVDPANYARLGEGSLSCFLRVSPAVAIRRLEAARGSRPLLAGLDPVGALERLARARESAYLQANHALNVDSMTPAEVADTIVALAMGHRAD